MPELPEVTVIVNSLNKKISGLILDSIEYDWPKKFFWNGFSIKDLKGKKVVGIRRLGKVVVIDLARNSGPVSRFPPAFAKASAGRPASKVSAALPLEAKRSGVGILSTTATRISILIHLKLTGQLIYQDKKTRVAGGHPIPPLNLPVPNKTTRVTFTFTKPSTHSIYSGSSTSSGQAGGHLYFNDLRKFGWVRIVESEKLKVESSLEKLGPDALEISLKDFSERIRKKPNAAIKKLLMDQSFISGVGNIYSDEALWRAKIHPKRSVISLSDKEMRALFDGVGDSMNLAISKGGSSANAFVDSGGERGLYLTFAKAYHMTGKPCERCKTPIVREKMDGRSAHFCPQCQKLK